MARRDGDSANCQKRQAWTAEEDELLKQQVARYGTQNWPDVAAGLQGRTSKACSLRWRCFLSPHIIRPCDEPFSEWEIAAIVLAQRLCGNKWNDIAQHLPMRCNNDIKNHFNLYLKEKQQKVTAGNCFLRQGYSLQGLLDEVPPEVGQRRERLDKAKAADRQSHLHPARPNKTMSALLRKAGGMIRPQLQPPPHHHHQQQQRRGYHPYLRVMPVPQPLQPALTGRPAQQQPRPQQQQQAFAAFPMANSSSNTMSSDVTPGTGAAAPGAPLLLSSMVAAYSPAGCRPVGLDMLPRQLQHVKTEQQQAAHTWLLPGGAAGHAQPGHGSSSNSSCSSYDQCSVQHTYNGCNVGSLADAGSGGSVTSASLAGFRVQLGSSNAPLGPHLAVLQPEEGITCLPSRLHQASRLGGSAAENGVTGPVPCGRSPAELQQLPVLKFDPESESDGAIGLSAADAEQLLAAGADVDPRALYSLLGSDDGDLPAASVHQVAGACLSAAAEAPGPASGSCTPQGQHHWLHQLRMAGSAQSGSSSPEDLVMRLQQSGSPPPCSTALLQPQQQQREQPAAALQLGLIELVTRASHPRALGQHQSLPPQPGLTAANTTSCSQFSGQQAGAFNHDLSAATAAAVAAIQAHHQVAARLTPFARLSTQQQQMHRLSSGDAKGQQQQLVQQQLDACPPAAMAQPLNTSSSSSSSRQQAGNWGCSSVAGTLLQSAALAMARVAASAPTVAGLAAGGCSSEGPGPTAAGPLGLLLPLLDDAPDGCEELSDLEELLQGDEVGLGALEAVVATAADEEGSGLADCDGLVVSDDAFAYDDDECCYGQQADLQAQLHLLRHRAGSDALDVLAAVW